MKSVSALIITKNLHFPFQCRKLFEKKSIYNNRHQSGLYISSMKKNLKKIFSDKAFKIAFYYYLFGAIWILASDKIVDYLFPERDVVVHVQTYKGWFFVAITGLLVYHLIRLELQKIKKAENKLIETQQRFNDVAENAEEWIWEIDAGGTYIYSSSAVTKLLGFLPSEIVGKVKFHDLYDPGSRDGLKKRADAIFSRKESFTKFQNKKLTRDGREKWLLTSAFPVFDESGNFAGYRGTDFDITERVEKELQLRESEERYRSIFNAYSAGIIIFNPAREIVNANPIACGLFGYSSEEIKKIRIHELLRDEFPRSASDISPSINAGQSEFEAVSIKKNGESFTAHFILTLFNYNKTTHMLALITDVTEKKFADEELKKYRDHLETLVAERTRELEGLNKVLEIEIQKQKEAEQIVQAALAKEKELNDLKSGFLSMASHEFRTPLTAILSSAELLQRYSGKWDEERNLHHLGKIRNSVSHMNSLLDDVLTINKTQTGKLEPEFTNLDVSIFLGELIEEIKSLPYFDHTVEFSTVNLENKICTDPKLFRQCVENLLVNAVKYSPAESTVSLSAAGNDGRLTIVVKDRGKGIPVDELSKVFEPFYRIKTDIHLPGSGLGLAIVKRAVDSLNGSINVDSEINAGTIFTVVLPIRELA